MNRELDKNLGPRLVALLLIVALAAVVTLWSLNSTGASSQSVFAIYLAVDLISFAMISYIYRATMSGDGIRRVPILAGSLLVLLLVCVGFVA